MKPAAHGLSRRERANPRRGVTGFTLVELLVVIALIAVLMAMLLPALNRAKGAAYRANCTANQKQLTLAFILYEHDYNDFLPWPNWDSQPWEGVKGWLYTGPLRQHVAPGAPGSVQSGSLWPYLNFARLYWCPVDLQRTNQNARPPNGRGSSYRELYQQRLNQLGSFICNGAVSGYGQLWGNMIPNNTYKVSRFKATNYLLWEPDEGTPFWFNDGSSTPSEGFSTRHGDGGTLGTFGGQVVFLKYGIWSNLVNRSHSPDFWCAPRPP